jgi:hypothetical protein
MARIPLPCFSSSKSLTRPQRPAATAYAYEFKYTARERKIRPRGCGVASRVGFCSSVFFRPTLRKIGCRRKNRTDTSYRAPICRRRRCLLLWLLRLRRGQRLRHCGPISNEAWSVRVSFPRRCLCRHRAFMLRNGRPSSYTRSGSMYKTASPSYSKYIYDAFKLPQTAPATPALRPSVYEQRQ